MTPLTFANNAVISIVGMTDSGLMGVTYTTKPETVNLTPGFEHQVKINLSVQPEKAIAGNYTIMLRATFFERDDLKISVLYLLPIRIDI